MACPPTCRRPMPSAKVQPPTWQSKCAATPVNREMWFSASRKFLAGVPIADASSGGWHIPTGASGRRQLADWLASPDNPLTARVVVNRVWQHHFGKGIVATPSNFGLR